MDQNKIVFIFAQAFALIAVSVAASIEVRGCMVDGIHHKDFNDFVTGVDGCARCVCVANELKCDASKCQKRAINVEQPVQFFMPTFKDFVNIKNQIAKQYFAEYDTAKLQVITEMLGCKTLDCPQLLDITTINYNVLSLYRQEYTGRVDKQNKVVIHSTDAEVVNNGPSKQEVQTVSYSIKVQQFYELIITKTTDISSEIGIQVSFIKFGAAFRFSKTPKETMSMFNETTLVAPSQKVVVDPFTKMNVTFNFYQYEDINKYFLDFEIAKNSTIAHPEVDGNSKVVFVKKPFGNFLQTHVDFLPTLKYENDNVIKLEAEDDKFILRNFPATEKITNFGVDVVFGKPEQIK